MITTRRQVINEQEKFDAYDKPASKSRVYADDAETSINEEVYTGFSGDNTAKSRSAQVQEFAYSNRAETVRRAKPASEIVDTVKIRRNKEDFMPVITRSKKAEETEEIAESVKEERVAASTRTKVILAVYLAVVIILAAVVIGTGVAVTNSLNSVTGLEIELSSKKEIVLEQEQRLNDLSDPANIEKRAAEMNMGKVKNIVYVETSQGIEPVTYEPRTNWFDKFCDWLSGIFN